MAREEEIVKERLRKLEELRKKGVNPYAYKFEKDNTCEELQKKYEKLKAEAETKDKAKTAGRLMTIRDMGNIAFATLRDSSGKIQIVLRKKDTPEKVMDFFSKYIDAGDFIGVEGKIIKTRTGELSILAEKIELLTKSILPLPEKFHGITDKEERYRKRYLDLIMNPEVKVVFEKRQIVFDAIREFLKENGYKEVQTPILQPIYGGTNAKPFASKLNALDMNVYMRISNEMYLKRLIGGGYEKVFEFSPDFRNEGIDKIHNPEFTQVETMWAYADYKDNMKFWPKLIEYVAKKVNGTTKVKYEDKEIDLKAPWKEVKFLEIIKEHSKIDFSKIKTIDEAKKAAGKLGIDAKECETKGEVMISVFEEIAQPKLIQPTLVYDYPIEATALARTGEDKDFTKTFEVIINGWEVAFSYCEENNPEELENKWKKQEEALAKGDEEAQRLDDDFLNMLKIGMPPTSGVGMGIDRLVMLLTDSASIRDVILFPFMKPEQAQENNKEIKKEEKKEKKK